MTDWRHTALALLGAFIAMTAVVLFVAGADYDDRFTIRDVRDDPPHGVVDVQPYEGLSERQRAIFERARDGETVRFEDESPMPAVVEVDGTYYVAAAPRYFDVTDYRTFGPILLFGLGVATSVQAVRLDLATSGTL